MSPVKRIPLSAEHDLSYLNGLQLIWRIDENHPLVGVALSDHDTGWLTDAGIRGRAGRVTTQYDGKNQSWQAS